jgi:hypothetical protein
MSAFQAVPPYDTTGSMTSAVAEKWDLYLKDLIGRIVTVHATSDMTVLSLKEEYYRHILAPPGLKTFALL